AQFETDKSYWLQKFESLPPLVREAKDAQSARERLLPVSKLKWSIARADYQRLESLAKAENVSVFQLWLGILATYFYRSTGQERLCIGIPVLNRSSKAQKNTIGLFTGLSPLLIDLNSQMTFSELLAQIRHTLRQDYRHQRFPIQELLRSLNHLTLGDRSLFQLSFSYMMQDMRLSLGDTTEQFNIMTGDQNKMPFDVWLRDFSSTGDVELDFYFLQAYFEEAEVVRIIERLKTIMQDILIAADQPVGKINILQDAERALLLHDFNDTATDYPKDKTIVQLFEEQVEQTPDQTAVVFEGRALSYRELNEQSNQLAHYLRDTYNIRPDDMVALQLERSEWMMVAIMGVLKSGAAYLPIGPDLPAARVAYMLENSAAKVLLTDAQTWAVSREQESLLPVLQVEQVKSECLENPLRINRSGDLAYIIYTSGSTGQPKGVLIEHQAIINVLFGVKEKVWDQHGAGLSTAVLASYSFDVSVQLILGSLLFGHSMHVISDDLKKDVGQLVVYLSQNGIEVFDCTPTLFNMMLEGGLNGIGNHELKNILIAGEALGMSSLNKFYAIEALAGVVLSNLYGPTEASVYTTFVSFIKSTYTAYPVVPIGKPLPNYEVFVLNPENDLLPIGIAGELHIGGSGLARGYLNMPDLTAEKFIPHPFKAGERLYKTGDLARWMPDGQIEYLGRIDHQLKIRGYRIEAGEIEQALLEHPAVQSCVVVGHKFEQGKELVAYLVLQTTGAQLDSAELSSFLGNTLPDYMIPAYFVELEALPMTSSGKVDRKALPAPDHASMRTGADYVAPRNERERLLADIWEQVLRRTGIGVHDNFFYAGGDSIKAIQISSRLGAAGWQLAMKELFAHPTIAGQANRMERKKRKYDQGLMTGDVPLTAVQQWFFDVCQVDQHHFNQAIMLEWSAQIDLDVLQTALQALVQQHDMLRAVYAPAGNGLTQTIGTGLQADLQLFFLPTGDDAQQLLLQKANEVQASFDLQTGPLFKAVVFRDEQGIKPDRLLLVIHHLVIDGVSWRILMEDLEIAYKQVLAGEKLKLTEKTASFQLWANTLSEYVAQQFPEQQIAYWNSVSEASRALPGFVPDQPDAENRMSDNRELVFLLSVEETNALLHQANQAYHTEINDLLLTALSRALHASFGSDAYSITLEGHGREEIVDLDISRTVGWFTSIFPFILSHHNDAGRHLQEVKEALRKVPNKGVGFGLLRYLADMKSLQGASQISFNYLGSFDQFGDNSNRLFGFSNAEVGDSSSPRAPRLHELDVLGMMIGGQLRISISYSAKRMAAARMESLIAEYQNALQSLIEHCVSVEYGRLSPADFSGCGMDMAEYDQFLAHHRLNASSIEDIYPLSSLQEGMLFEWMMNPDSPAYFVQLEINFGNRVDVVALKNAWQQLIKRHAILRTA
ncbi:MAG: amino acid adenylation domain-containing protein, partial [Bacteroidota bacterium]